MLWIIGGDLVHFLGTVSPGWLVATGMCWVSAFIIRGTRWRILLKPIRKNVTFSSSFWSISMSYLVNFILPTKWGSEAARAAALSKKENVSFLSTFSSILVEKVLDLLTMVMLATVTVLFLPKLDFGGWILSVLKVLALLAAVLVIGLFLISWKLKYLINKLKKHSNISGRISRAFTTIIISFAQGFGWICKNPLPFLYGIGLTFALWFIYSLGVYSVFQSLGISPDPFAVILGSLLFSFAYVLPNIPGYVGTYEGMWVLIFLGLGIGGSQIIFAGAVVGHLVSTLIIASLGSIGLVKTGLSLTESLRFKNRFKLKSNLE
ncbi:lysylphosphatidylglycerol synthase transmembrane domain-containing protein [[Eubacterium] cellulosolvens]